MSADDMTTLGPETIEVLVTRADSTLPLPDYSHPGDAGADLYASEAAVIEPLGRATIGTGIAFAFPDGFVGLVHPRSGLAATHGVTVLNGPGTVDAGYRGEIRITLHNTDPHTPFVVSPGDRIAQLVVQRIARAAFVEVTELPGSHRGDSGFGSTGRAARS